MTYDELVQLAVNTAEQCPTCAGCWVTRQFDRPTFCQRMIDQGMCQKQLWRWRQEAGLQAALIIAQIRAGQGPVVYEEVDK